MVIAAHASSGNTTGEAKLIPHSAPGWKNPVGTPEAGGMGAGIPSTAHDPCPLAMASHTVPVYLPN